MQKYNQIKISTYYHTKITDYFLKQYPNLKFGRKNYLNKEIEIAKNICLTKLYLKIKKIKNYKINSLVFNKGKNKITLTATSIFNYKL